MKKNNTHSQQIIQHPNNNQQIAKTTSMESCEGSHFQPQEMTALLAAHPDYIFCKNKQSQYIGCNTRFADLVGLDNPADIINLTDYDLPWQAQGHRAPFFQAGDQSTLAGESIINQTEILALPKQAARLMQVNKRPLRNTQGKIYGLFGMARDITHEINTAVYLEDLLAQAQSAAPHQHNSHTCKILIVEDSSIERIVLEYLFQHFDVQLTIRETAEAGFADSLEKQFDLIITDIRLPGKSGLDFARWLRDAFKNPPPIIALSSEMNEILKQQCLALGMQAAYEKPLSLKQARALLAPYNIAEIGMEKKPLQNEGNTA